MHYTYVRLTTIAASKYVAMLTLSYNILERWITTAKESGTDERREHHDRVTTPHGLWFLPVRGKQRSGNHRDGHTARGGGYAAPCTVQCHRGSHRVLCYLVMAAGLQWWP